MRALYKLAIVLVATPLCAAALAHEFRAGPITVDDPWARASIGATGNTAAYMKLANGGAAPDRLVAVKSDVAAHVSLHESRDDNGVIRSASLAPSTSPKADFLRQMAALPGIVWRHHRIIGRQPPPLAIGFG